MVTSPFHSKVTATEVCPLRKPMTRPLHILPQIFITVLTYLFNTKYTPPRLNISSMGKGKDSWYLLKGLQDKTSQRSLHIHAY